MIFISSARAMFRRALPSVRTVGRGFQVPFGDRIGPQKNGDR